MNLMLCIMLLVFIEECELQIDNHIVVTTAPYSYFAIIQFDPSTNQSVYTGLCFDMLNYITTKYNITYEVKPDENFLWGAPIGNGSWNGMIGKLVDGEAEVGVNDFTITHQRFEVVDFSPPFSSDAVSLILRNSPVEPVGIFQPLNLTVWYCCIASMFIVGVALFALNKLSMYLDMNHQVKDCSLLDCLFYVLGVQLIQGRRYWVIHTHCKM